jgi:hypothetical protein
MRIRVGSCAICLLLLSVCIFPIAQQDESKTRFLIFDAGKAGYIDASGNIVIAPRFASGTNFDHGRACVYDLENHNWKHQVINEDGNPLPERLGDCHEYSEGMAPVGFAANERGRACSEREVDCLMGYVDREGNIVIKPQFQSGKGFSEGLAAVENNENEWGFIDSSGKVMIPFQFGFASSFSSGLALVLIKDRYGYVDHTGKLSIQPQYRSADDFSEGLAIVRKNGYFIEPFGTHGGTKKDQHLDWEIIGPDGNTKFHLNSENVGSFSEGLAEYKIVKPDGHLYCGYIDKLGNRVIPARFESCDAFSEDMADVLLNGKYYFIDRTGQIVLTPPFSEVRPFHNGLAWVVEGDPSRATGSGYIDKTGKVVWISKH